MKALKNIMILLLVLIMGACGEDFLDTRPITEKTDGNYYANPADAMEALTGCYDALQLIYAGGISFPVASDVMSDLCFGGTGAGDTEEYGMIDEFDNAVSPSTLNMFEDNWKAYYKGIFRVNTLLMNLDNVDWGKQEGLRMVVEAEARFLRAYFYFDMVRLWEKVPLLTKPTSDNVPQAHPDSVYALIARDLVFAIENARKETYAQMATANYGRVTKWAAQGLLARVYLFYTGYYGKPNLVNLVTKEQTLNAVEDLIQNSGHNLVPNYYDLWPAAAQYQADLNNLPIDQNTYAGENNIEVVFGIKYTYTSDYNGNTDGNHWLVMNGLRKMSWKKSGYGSGWGACTVTPSFYQSWNSADQRKQASVMAIQEEGITYTEIKDVREYTGYFTKKYIPLCDANGNSIAEQLGGVNFMIGQYQDFFVLRFADVLLMAAELGSPNAVSYLNRVRIRAGLEETASADKDAIYQERMYELAFEGIRYWDLLRYDNTLQYAANKVSFSGSLLSGGVPTDKSISSGNLLLTRGLSQIPYNQITLSGGVLVQNQGW